jgi:hypothetical protein
MLFLQMKAARACTPRAAFVTLSTIALKRSYMAASFRLTRMKTEVHRTNAS